MEIIERIFIRQFSAFQIEINTGSACDFEQFLSRKWVLHQNRTDRQYHKKSGLPKTGEAAFMKNTN